MSSFFLPKFGNVDVSFLGFLKSDSIYTIITGASAGPTLNGNAALGSWNYQLDDTGTPDPGVTLTQRQVNDLI
jgi:hypothetical protein